MYPPNMGPQMGINQQGMYQQNMGPMGPQMGMNQPYANGKGRNSKKKNEISPSASKSGSPGAKKSGTAAKGTSVYSGYGKKKKKPTGADIAYRCVLIIALLTLLGAGGYLGIHYYNEAQRNAATERDDALNAALSGQYSAEMNVSSDDGRVTLNETLTKSKEIIPKLKTLYEENGDTVGWIKINNTVIDYPVMQRKAEDEAAFYGDSSGDVVDEYYYLHKNFDKEYSYEGSIFAFFSNEFGPEGLSRNTVLFGHHMRSGRMFQNLMSYDALIYNSGRNGLTVNNKALNFYKNNPIILFDSLYEEARWVIFAVVKADPELEARSTEINWMFVEDPSPEEQQMFIDNIRKRSVIDTTDEIEVTPDDYLLILQTCSYEMDESRTLVIARKLRDDETTIDVSTATVAENPILPGRLCRAKGYN